MIDLDALEALEKAATNDGWHIGHVDENLGHAMIEGFHDEIAEVYNRRNQAFICEMRNALPELIAELRAAREVVRCAREDLGGSWEEDVYLTTEALAAYNAVVAEKP